MIVNCHSLPLESLLIPVIVLMLYVITVSTSCTLSLPVLSNDAVKLLFFGKFLILCSFDLYFFPCASDYFLNDILIPEIWGNVIESIDNEKKWRLLFMSFVFKE